MNEPNKILNMLRKPRQIDPEEEHQRIVRGERAEALLRDDAFREALESIEAVYMGAWRNSEAIDVERRERAHIAVCLLDDLRNLLIDYVRQGAVAREIVEKSLHPK